MNNIVNPFVEGYIRGLLPENNSMLKGLEKYAQENHVPIVYPEVAKLLQVITKISKAKKILEVGTAIGYSAIILCNAMENGQLLTIEKRTDMVELAKENIKNAGFDLQVKIVQGNAEEILPSLNEEFDLIFLDAAKGQYMEFLSSSMRLLKYGGILICDNVLYKGMVASDEYVVRRKRTIVNRMRTYLDYIMDHPYLDTALLPIGDGVTISYKRGRKESE